MSDCYVATVGMFDGFHKGHKDLISQLLALAAEHGMKSCVISFGNHPLSYLAPERAPKNLMKRDVMYDLICEQGVDDVKLFDFDQSFASMTAYEFLKQLHDHFDVRVLLMGFNNSFGSDRLRSREEYVEAGKKAGVELLFAKEYKINGITPTSTLQRKYIAEGRLDDYAAMANCLYHLCGTVVKGKQNGRKIGFPTFNVDLDDKNMLVPASGVYKGAVVVNDDTCMALINIGTNPTIGVDNPQTIEAHAIGRDYGDCYGKAIKVVFEAKIRDEKKFASLEELQRAIEADVKAVVG